MNRETFESQKQFAGEAKPSMKRRAVEHDYTERRIYMITMAVEGRRPLLGWLVGDVRAGRGKPESPRVEPTPLGKAVEQAWHEIPRHHPEVSVLGFQLMPDHIHGILFVERQLAVGLGRVILGFKQGCNKAYRVGCVAVGQQQGGVAVVQRHTQQHTQQHTQRYAQQHPQQLSQQRGMLFERGYHDRILLHAGQLDTLRAYIADNPYRLAMKRAKPELLRVRLNVNIYGRNCSAVGNMALLQAPRRIQVRVSRSIDPVLLAQEKERLLTAAREGAVLVSPAISPGEKAIMRAAFDEGLQLIALMENGLDPMAKPSGQRFNATAEGRLLLISPFPHHGERRTISRRECEQLNALAWDITQTRTTNNTITP